MPKIPAHRFSCFSSFQRHLYALTSGRERSGRNASAMVDDGHYNNSETSYEPSYSHPSTPKIFSTFAAR